MTHVSQGMHGTWLYMHARKLVEVEIRPGSLWEEESGTRHLTVKWSEVTLDEALAELVWHWQHSDEP